MLLLTQKNRQSDTSKSIPNIRLETKSRRILPLKYVTKYDST